MESTLKNRYDSVIFDLDGTLWDSTDTITEAWQTALHKAPYMSHEVMTRERVRSITGMTYDKIFETLFPYLSTGQRSGAKVLLGKRTGYFA